MKHDAERVPYGKVARRIWRDAKFRALGKDARLLFLYLLTAPDMRGVGILVGCPVSIRADLPELGIRRIRAALRELVGVDLVEWDEGHRVIWLPTFGRFNTPESPNVVKNWLQARHVLPECGTVWRAFSTLLRSVSDRDPSYAAAVIAAFPPGFFDSAPEPAGRLPGKASGKAFGKASPKASGNQEQEQKRSLSPPSAERAGARAPAAPGTGDSDAGPPATGPREARGLVPGVGWVARRSCLNVPEVLHREFLSRNVPGVDEAALCAWYAGIESAIGEGPVRGSVFVFWNRKFRLKWPEAAPERRGRSTRSGAPRETFLEKRARLEREAAARPKWWCHHAALDGVDTPRESADGLGHCVARSHCYLRTLRQVRAGTERLEDVPEPIRSEVIDGLEAEQARRAKG